MDREHVGGVPEIRAGEGWDLPGEPGSSHGADFQKDMPAARRQVL